MTMQTFETLFFISLLFLNRKIIAQFLCANIVNLEMLSGRQHCPM